MSKLPWIDLAAIDRPHQEVQADVCVVGAGAAGIYLTLQLARQGHSVVLLEAGPAKCTDATTTGFDALFDAVPYPGAIEGRFFGMGGSTSRWGGMLVPHTVHDLREASASAMVWTHIVDIVTREAPQVLADLGYRNGWDFESSAEKFLGQTGGLLRAYGLSTQVGLALPFQRKNFVGLLDKVTDCTVTPRIFFNAVAKSWTIGSGPKSESRVTGLVAVSKNNNSLKIIAGKFIVAAGAIESARILLEIEDIGSQSALRSSAATGCYLADHLSVSIADVAPASRGRVAALFAPRFSGSWMRSFRLLESAPPLNAPRAFAHLIFLNSGDGFKLAKQVLGAMQERRLPSISVPSIAAGMTDLVGLAYGRFWKSELRIPTGTLAHLQLDLEQRAVRDNRVTLSKQRDAYGRYRASIHWQVAEHDLVALTETAQRFLKKLSDSTGELPQFLPRAIGSVGTKPYDAYHPAGTSRMGEDSEAVVDLNLKVWGVQNLWVVSTGVLPSAGTANPTFSLLCFAHQLAKHLHTAH